MACTSENFPDAVIEAKGLSAGYGGVALLENLDFEIRRGEILVLLGGSGCGKSTLSRTLEGLVPPVRGEVRLLGQPFASADHPADEADSADLRRRIGVMFQSGALFGSMSLLQNVAVPLREFTELPEEIVERVARAKLGQVGLAAYADYYPREISGGMQKRAAIARALALDPDVLFLDEPSAGLDPVTSAQLDDLVLHIRQEQGTTFVVVSHELASVFRIADRCLFLDRAARGILDQGAPAALRDASPHPAVRAFFNRDPSAVADAEERDPSHA